MNNLIFGDLTIRVSQPTSQLLRLDWLGKSNHPQPESALNPFFTELVGEIQLRNWTLEMHFEKLEFFNSSTIASILHHIRYLCDRKIKTTLFFEPTHKWQKIFFDALWFLDKGDGVFSVQPVGSLKK